MSKTKKEIEKLRGIRSDLRIARADFEALSNTATMDISVLENITNAISKIEHEIALREA